MRLRRERDPGHSLILETRFSKKRHPGSSPNSSSPGMRVKQLAAVERSELEEQSRTSCLMNDPLPHICFW